MRASLQKVNIDEATRYFSMKLDTRFSCKLFGINLKHAGNKITNMIKHDRDKEVIIGCMDNFAI